MADDDELLRPDDAARYLGNISSGYLGVMRHMKKGPSYFRARGGRVFYQKSDLDKWQATKKAPKMPDRTRLERVQL